MKMVKNLKATPHSPRARLAASNFTLSGDWTPEEARRILAVLTRLESLSGSTLPALFNGQPTRLHKSGRAGRAGRTRGKEVFLDESWTDWTLAHELGHRWNNAWGRNPQRDLQKALRAGRWEWIKYPLRRFERRIERLLARLGSKKRIDWQPLWYHPGDAPPPCGLDRNFNAGEDLAECFAASLLPAQGRARAKKVAQRATHKASKGVRGWDWGTNDIRFEETPRGKILKQFLSGKTSG